MDQQKDVSSVVQQSTFTKIKSIPREQSYKDLPVTVHLTAAEMTVHQHAPVDIVAVIDVSESMLWDCRLALVKEAMAKVVKNLGGDAKNRLAIVAFDDRIKQSTELAAMTDQGQQSAQDTVNALRPLGETNFSIGLNQAAKILDNRDEAAKKRLSFIFFFSDGVSGFTNFDQDSLSREYPIHAFGISSGHSATELQAMAKATSGSYTPFADEHLDKITEKLDQLSDTLTSVVAVDTVIRLQTTHPGVSLSRIDEEPSAAAASGDSSMYSNTQPQVAEDRRSAEIAVGDVSSGKEREFTVYLDVPEGAVEALLTVGGLYKQSWDQQEVALAESAVTVARPPPPPPPASYSGCKELEWIEERVQYWCKAKLDLSAMYDKMEAELADAGVSTKLPAGNDDAHCQCQVTAALREASMEAINRAMHHDIYTVTLLAIKLRHCLTGGATATDNDAPSTPAEPAN